MEKWLMIIRRGVSLGILLFTLGFGIGGMVQAPQDNIYYLSFISLLIAELMLVASFECSITEKKIGHYMINIAIVATAVFNVALSTIILKIACAVWVNELVLAAGVNSIALGLVGIIIMLLYHIGLDWDGELEEEQEEVDGTVQEKELLAMV